MIQSSLYKIRQSLLQKRRTRKMREYSKNLFTRKLPKGFELQESVDKEGVTQTSLSFPFAVIWKKGGLEFADKFNDAIRRRDYDILAGLARARAAADKEI
jgi:hypothetical protein